MHHLERHAVEWIEIRSGRIKVRKGNARVVKMQQISLLIAQHELPTHTAVWITKSRSVHFKPNFPQALRQTMREIMLS